MFQLDKQRVNNMKLEIGKLYKLNGESVLYNNSTLRTNYRPLKKGIVFVLLDGARDKFYYRVKILTENACVGWVIFGWPPEYMFTKIYDLRDV